MLKDLHIRIKGEDYDTLQKAFPERGELNYIFRRVATALVAVIEAKKAVLPQTIAEAVLIESNKKYKGAIND